MRGVMSGQPVASVSNMGSDGVAGAYVLLRNLGSGQELLHGWPQICLRLRVAYMRWCVQASAIPPT